MRIDMGCHEYQFEPVLVPISLTLEETLGDGDGIPEQGETLRLNATVENAGEAASGIHAALLCGHPDVLVTGGFAAYPDLAPGETAAAVSDFTWQVTGRSGWCLPADFTVNWKSGGVFLTIDAIVLGPGIR